MEKRIHLEETLPDELANKRLDQALAALFPSYSRSQLQDWIKNGYVSINGKIITKVRELTKAQQHIEISATIETHEAWQGQDIPLNIIHEDEALLVINKPAGLVVHPGAGNPDSTLVNALLHHFSELSLLPRAGIIHRLDKDTSGLLIVARQLEAYNYLSKAMQQRDISREYQAIVNGVMISGDTIDAPIGRHPHHRIKMAIARSGRESITHYRILKRFRAHTHINVKLETGRTHQIRVHMAHINYPIVGDPSYGKQTPFFSKLSEPLKKKLKLFKRQALHAYSIRLTHPSTQTEMSWQAPLPNDMSDLLNALQEDADTNETL